MRKIFAVLFMLCAVVSFALAETINYSDGDNRFYCDVNSDGSVTITKFDGSGDVAVPAQIDGRYVTAIGRYAFYNNAGITSVSLPEGLAIVDESAFDSCKSLTSVNLPDGLMEIGSAAFSGCKSLTSINFPDGLTSVGNSAFSGCQSLTSANLPDGLAVIGKSAFTHCSSLTTVTLPDSLTYIGANAFFYCRSLTSITIPDGIAEIRDSTFYYCDSLTSVTLPEGLTRIGASSFYECTGITSLTLPDSVTDIGDYAFVWCKSLTSITFPEELTHIGYYAFSSCRSLTSITLPEKLTQIDGFAFNDCEALSTVSFPDGLTEIGNYAFTGCDSLKALTLPAGLIQLGEGAFRSCSSLSSVAFPDSLAVIGDLAFNYCDSLTTLNFRKGLESIGDSAFRCCESLTSVTLPDGLKYIGAGAFEYCKNLTSVVFPDSLCTIGSSAFSYCSSLSSVTLSTRWKSEIGNFAFRSCTSLASVTLQNGLTRIGRFAFSSCESLSSVTLPEGLTYIGDSAFFDCDALTSVTLPGTLAEIGNGIFSSCPDSLIATVTRNSYAEQYCIGTGTNYIYGGVHDMIIDLSAAALEGLHAAVVSTINEFYTDTVAAEKEIAKMTGKVLTEAVVNKIVKELLNKEGADIIEYLTTACSDKALATLLKDAKKACGDEIAEAFTARLRENVKTEILSRIPEDCIIPDGQQTDNSGIKAGRYITFGCYPQTKSGDDSTPIKWHVLDVQDGKALLISEYGLDVQPYDTARNYTTWEKCSLRNWLNTTFMKKAFSAEETEAILITNVDNSMSQCVDYSYDRFAETTNGGNDTEDKLFLLSYAEANKYFKVTSDNSNNVLSRAEPTAYAIKKGATQFSNSLTAWNTAAGYWWLRSPGTNQSEASYVYPFGSLYSDYVNSSSVCVRPAMWIDLAYLDSNNALN